MTELLLYLLLLYCAVTLPEFFAFFNLCYLEVSYLNFFWFGTVKCRSGPLMVHIKFATFADGGFLRPVKREEKRNDFNMYGEVLVPKKPGSIHVKSVS